MAEAIAPHRFPALMTEFAPKPTPSVVSRGVLYHSGAGVPPAKDSKLSPMVSAGFPPCRLESRRLWRRVGQITRDIHPASPLETPSILQSSKNTGSVMTSADSSDAPARLIISCR
jgi:hypothetical protein